MVLLKNDDGMLPIDRSSIATLAVVGPNAERARIMGGGSASFTPHYRVPPLDALQDAGRHRREDRLRAGLRHRAHDPADRRRLRHHRRRRCRAGPAAGRPPHLAGRACPAAAPRSAPPRRSSRRRPDRMCCRSCSSARRACCSTARSSSTASPIHRRAAASSSRWGARPSRPPSTSTRARTSSSSSTRAARAVRSKACRWDAARCRPSDLMDRAVAAAASADATIVVVGTNDDWESEGHDREFMELPGDQAELIRRVAAANPRTVVAVNAASPVTMDWADAVPAVLVTWFGGQEMANALADVLFGETDPSGRLPTTFPGPARAQPVVRQLSRRERAGALRRRRLRRVPLVRSTRAARRLPVRPRLVVHHVRDRRPAPVGDHVHRGRGQHAHDRGRRDQHRHASRRRSGAVLRGAAPPGRDPSGEGAQGLRQGVARAGRVDHRRARARRPRLLVLAARGRRTTTRPYAGPRSRPPNRLPHPTRDGGSSRATTTSTSAGRRPPPRPPPPSRSR